MSLAISVSSIISRSSVPPETTTVDPTDVYVTVRLGQRDRSDQAGAGRARLLLSLSLPPRYISILSRAGLDNSR